MTTAVVRYNAGNIHSIVTVLRRIGADYVVTDDPKILKTSARVIFPGVGEASSAMSYLRERGLDTVLCSLTNPVLGICLGLQLLCNTSEENDAKCLGIVDLPVRKLTKARKIPHTGWSRVHHSSDALFADIPQDSYFYFVHSFAAEVGNSTIGRCYYDEEFSAAVSQGKFYGVQFHPEKSGIHGQTLLQNFISMGTS